MEKIKFNSFFDPVEEVTDDSIYDHFVSSGHLDYDEHGIVIPVDDGKIDFYQMIQSDKDSSTLSAQIKSLVTQGQTAPGNNFMDVSDIADNEFDEAERLKTLEKAAKRAAADIGIDEKDLKKTVSLSEEQINELINKKVNEMLSKQVGSVSEQSTIKENEVK